MQNINALFNSFCEVMLLDVSRWKSCNGCLFTFLCG